MFEYLGKYESVVVTGSGRSGTHICADMIASDLGYRYTPETDFAQNDWGRFTGWLDQGGVVIQAPDLWASLGEIPEGVALCVVHRPIKDIMASWARGGYQPKDSPVEVYRFLEGLRPQSHTYWIEYHRLSNHPLWVPPEVRRERRWGWAQTRLPEGATV